jgi:hypothetical protein
MGAHSAHRASGGTYSFTHDDAETELACVRRVLHGVVLGQESWPVRTRFPGATVCGARAA